MIAPARLVGGLLLAGATVARAQQPLPAPDRARLGARRDSLRAIAASGPVGWLRMSRAPLADGGVRYIETLEVEDVADLTTLLVTDSLFFVRQLRQTGEAWDQVVAVSLDAQGGRVRGHATRAGARGPVLGATDDAALPRPELNAVPLLLVATPWAAGQAGTWVLHDAASGQPVTLAVAVEAFEPASAAGPAAWRVAVRRGGTTTRYRVAAAAPWRLLSVATDGSPFRFSAP